MKIIYAIIVIILLTSCTNNAIPSDPSDGIEPTGPLSCETDADCVPKDCCHSKSCINVAEAPDCTGIVCSLGCEIGTTDCGGGCYCDNGKCAAILYGENDSLVRTKWR